VVLAREPLLAEAVRERRHKAGIAGFTRQPMLSPVGALWMSAMLP